MASRSEIGSEEERRVSDPMLVLTEVFPPKVGGSGRWLFEVLTRRQSAASICVLAPPLPEGVSEIETPLKNLRIRREYKRPIETGFFSPRGVIGYLGSLRVAAKMHRADQFRLVISGSCLTTGWVAWLLKKRHGIPYVCLVHGEEVYVPETGDVSGTLSSRQHRLMTRWVLHGADRVIANSENTRDILTTTWGLPEEDVRVVHPGVDTNRYVPAERCDIFRRNVGWEGRKVVITVGRLQRRKGHDTMIRALPSIRQSIPNILYVIVGDGEELSRLKGLADEFEVEECVQFHTSIVDRDLIPFYQQSDLFVLPNRQVGSDIEGFGIVLLEAQACGLPVIAGASGGTKEAVDCGRSGYIIPCDNPFNLEECVMQLLSDGEKAATIGRYAREWAVKRFDWGILARKFEQAMNR